MKPAPVVSTVRVGSLRLDVRRYADGRHGFDYQPPGQNRVKVRVHEMGSAEERAREILGGARGGKVERLSIDESEYAEFLRWKADRKKPAMIPALAAEFIAMKEGRGRSAKHCRDIRQALTLFATSFPGAIGDLTSAEVERWLNARNVGPRRWNNLLTHVISLHHYARRQRLLPAERTPVECIERKEVDVIVHTYSPEEMVSISRAVPSDWLPVIILGAFCGIRPEEVAPEKRSMKKGLTWESVLWRKRKVDISPTVAKDRRRRFAPLTDAAMAFLAPWRHAKGLIAPEGRVCDQTKAWERTSGVKWIPDGLRHSFASYRLALTKDMPALALEMGNSMTMIHRHYLDLKHRSDAVKWFAIRPESAKSAIRIASKTHAAG